jgi:phosphate transport system protein
MDRKFEEELEELKQELLEVGAKIERNIADAIQALVERDPRLAAAVAGRDPEIDLAEIRIDEHCLSVLALRQPVARDLRFIATALKIVKDMERIGDMAKDIAGHAESLAREVPLEIAPDIPILARSAQGMLNKALDAFVNRDPEMARAVIRDDDVVDELHRQVIDETIQLMLEKRDLIGPYTQLLYITKYLERIGDHSSNIAEMVVFMVEGKDIRHHEKIKGMRGTRTDAD